MLKKRYGYRDNKTKNRKGMTILKEKDSRLLAFLKISANTLAAHLQVAPADPQTKTSQRAAITKPLK